MLHLSRTRRAAAVAHRVRDLALMCVLDQLGQSGHEGVARLLTIGYDVMAAVVSHNLTIRRLWHQSEHQSR